MDEVKEDAVVEAAPEVVESDESADPETLEVNAGEVVSPEESAS